MISHVLSTIERTSDKVLMPVEVNLDGEVLLMNLELVMIPTYFNLGMGNLMVQCNQTTFKNYA